MISENSNWLNETLYPKIYNIIIHHTLSGEYNFYNDSRFFELYAIDFIMDDNLNLYFLENNFNP